MSTSPQFKHIAASAAARRAARAKSAKDPEAAAGVRAVSEARKWAERCYFDFWIIGPEEIPRANKPNKMQEELHEMLFHPKTYTRGKHHARLAPTR